MNLHVQPAAAVLPGFSFVVPGIPTPWARAGGGLTVHRFTPAKQRAAMRAIGLIARAAMHGARPLEGPIRLEVIATYAWPASWSARRRREPAAKWKTSRPDFDNALFKLVADSLNGVAWIDDAQVAAAHGWKMYGDMPGLAVRVGVLA